MYLTPTDITEYTTLQERLMGHHSLALLTSLLPSWLLCNGAQFLLMLDDPSGGTALVKEWKEAWTANDVLISGAYTVQPFMREIHILHTHTHTHIMCEADA